MLSYEWQADFIHIVQLAHLMISSTPVDDFPFAEGQRIGTMLAVATKENPTEQKTRLIQEARLHWHNIRLLYFTPEGNPPLAYLFFRSLASAYSTTVAYLLEDWMPVTYRSIRDLDVETEPLTEPKTAIDHTREELSFTFAKIEKHTTNTRHLSMHQKTNIPHADLEIYERADVKALWEKAKLATDKPAMPMTAERQVSNQSAKTVARKNGYSHAPTGGLNPTRPSFRPSGSYTAQQAYLRHRAVVRHNPQDFKFVPRGTWGYREV